MGIGHIIQDVAMYADLFDVAIYDTLQTRTTFRGSATKSGKNFNLKKGGRIILSAHLVNRMSNNMR